MTEDTVVTIIQNGLLAIILASAPPLVMGLVVGVAVSIFQTVTSIQEPTLAFIPKILAVLLSLILFGPFIFATLNEYTVTLFNNLRQYVIPK